MGLGKYLKTAFLNRWNLLALIGGGIFALLSGYADVVLPLVLAGEAAYVGLLGSHPKFQQYVDAQQAKAARAEGTSAAQHTLDRITQALPKELLARFVALRGTCLELRQIALELKHPGKPGEDLPLDEFQVAGLDRLLWIHLRLLYTQFALARFLKATSQERIEQDIAQLEKRLAAMTKDPADRFRRAVDDNLATSRARLDNLKKAQENYELVKLEIDRLENKIRSLSELAVNRQEPEFITGQVDHVAASMLETEKTMNELRFATGLDEVEENPPELMRAPVVQAGK